MLPAPPAPGRPGHDRIRRMPAQEIRDSPAEHRPPSARSRIGRPFRRSHPYYIGFVGGLGLILAYYLANALMAITDVLILIVIALVLAVGLSPFVDRLTDRGVRRGWAVLIVAVSLLVLFGGFITAIAQPLADQTTGLINSLPQHLQQVSHNPTIERLDAKYNVVGRLQSTFAQADFAQAIAGGILGFGTFLISSVFKTFTVIVLTLYFLGSLPTIKQGVYGLVPASRRERVGLLGDEVLSRIGGYVSGAVLVALMAALAALAMLSSLDIPYMLPLALLIGLTDLIPLIGATFGALIVVLVTLFDSPTKAVVAGLFFIVYQQFENFVIYPRVMARSVDVPAMIAVIAALLGAAVFGVIGALLAIPLSAGLLYVAREVLLPRQERV